MRNTRLLFWGRALTEVKVLNAIIVLFYIHRGVTVEEVFYLTLVWSLATLAFEIPSGYLADRIGRKQTMMLGAVLLLGAWVSQWFAHGFFQFAGVVALMSASFSMFSGTEEAFLYDSLKEIGKEREMTKWNGRLVAARNFAKMFLPAVGAIIAKDLLESQFRILIAADIVLAVTAFIILAFLTEPKHVKSVEKFEIGVFRQAMRTIRQQPFLLKAAMNKLLIFIGAIIVFRTYQPLFSEMNIAVIWLSVFYFLLHVVSFLFRWYSHRLEDWFGTVRSLTFTAWATIASLIIAIFVNVPWLVFVGVLASMIFSAMRTPLFAHFMNKRIESRSRATTISSLNVIKGILDVPILLLTGWLVTIDIEYGLVVAAVLTGLVVIFFPIRQKNLK